jgi:Flp pilus assembly protein TadD
MLALREACYSSDSDARLWTLYAMSCLRAGRARDGAQALRQALWLRERVRDDARAQVTRRLIDRADLDAA